MGLEIIAEGTREEFERVLAEKVSDGYEALGEMSIAAPKVSGGAPPFVYYNQLVFKTD